MSVKPLPSRALRVISASCAAIVVVVSSPIRGDTKVVFGENGVDGMAGGAAPPAGDIGTPNLYIWGGVGGEGWNGPGGAGGDATGAGATVIARGGRGGNGVPMGRAGDATARGVMGSETSATALGGNAAFIIAAGAGRAGNATSNSVANGQMGAYAEAISIAGESGVRD